MARDRASYQSCQGDRKGTPDAGGATSLSHCCYQSCQGDRKGTPLPYTRELWRSYRVGAYPCGRPGGSRGSQRGLLA